ncbi:hypothetical protein BaRGS_00024738, partial [Batillaria attramentaria]
YDHHDAGTRCSRCCMWRPENIASFTHVRDGASVALHVQHMSVTERVSPKHLFMVTVGGDSDEHVQIVLQPLVVSIEGTQSVSRVYRDVEKISTEGTNSPCGENGHALPQPSLWKWRSPPASGLGVTKGKWGTETMRSSPGVMHVLGFVRLRNVRSRRWIFLVIAIGQK